MLNVVAVNGRLIRSPWIDEEKGFGYLDVAVKRNYKNKSTGKTDTDFLSFVIHGKTLSFSKKYLKIGSCVDIEGTVQSMTKGEGQDRKTSLLLVASRVEFAASQFLESNTGTQKPDAVKSQQNKPAEKEAPAVNPDEKKGPDPAAKAAASEGNNIIGEDEDLPF